ncbi:hypothetical protein E2C01_070100 [Portunus trituberculatus]|uniref:Uncharacterized protein n=1 Tax=Portunus trituberculatus TaxID=210409 RepID=A0A5B7I2M9_PORTR|nr:hypothetical protein [Portunus trituberculatus]
MFTCAESLWPRVTDAAPVDIHLNLDHSAQGKSIGHPSSHPRSLLLSPAPCSHTPISPSSPWVPIPHRQQH